MSMREFLDADCGQLNPVLKVASHFTQDVSLRESLAAGGLGHGAAAGSRTVDDDQYLHQYLDPSPQDMSLLPPTSFQMDSLLKEIQSMENASYQQQIKGPVQAPNVADLATQKDWAEEFLKNEHSLKVTGAAWAGDYFAAELDPVWDTSRENYSFPSQLPIGSSFSHQRTVEDKTMPTAQELLDDSKWAIEYIPPATSSKATEKTELMATAEDFLKSVSDPSIKATEFMSFVEKLSIGDSQLGDDKTEATANSDQWASEFAYQARNDTGNQSDWVQEFASQNKAYDMTPGASAAVDGREDFWQKLQDEWERLAQEDTSHPWLTEHTQQIDEAYKFAEENPFQQTVDPLSEGKRKLLEGDIPSAVLLFESASQKYPDNAECWLLLGTTQAQNEQDPLAISALNKCLTIQPDNMIALMSLAASLTNESYHLQASNTLKKWLKSNSKYSRLLWPEESEIPMPGRLSTILPSEELVKVQRMFIEAARQNPTTGVDPDVQSGLGILFNLGSEYDKAADCFAAALNVNPDDSLLWNRLGATLANGGKSAEAISAYRRALEISPGFIRTRYNLGIACVNLGAYREAAEHFLTSLNMQSSGKAIFNSKSGSVMSDSIWTSLRMILHLLDKGHLTKSIDTRDLNFLNNEFNMTP